MGLNSWLRRKRVTRQLQQRIFYVFEECVNKFMQNYKIVDDAPLFEEVKQIRNILDQAKEFVPQLPEVKTLCAQENINIEHAVEKPYKQICKKTFCESQYIVYSLIWIERQLKPMMEVFSDETYKQTYHRYLNRKRARLSLRFAGLDSLGSVDPKVLLASSNLFRLFPLQSKVGGNMPFLMAFCDDEDFLCDKDTPTTIKETRLPCYLCPYIKLMIEVMKDDEDWKQELAQHKVKSETVYEKILNLHNTGNISHFLSERFSTMYKEQINWFLADD